MRGLRKTRPGDRGIRPGLLILAALAALAGCSGRTPAGAVAGTGASWFQLQAGVFQRVADPNAAAPVARLPWTVQSRVADMAFFDNALYCALNGSGLASLRRGPEGAPVFAYHPDSLIFAHRTITTLIPRQGALAVHLYYNALLNDVPVQDLTLNGICLVSYAPSQADYSFLVPPFQRKYPDWEAVGIATESENSFDFEWKYTDATETRFQYTRFHADTLAEEPVDRETYLAALGVPSIVEPAVPSDLATFFAACRAGMPAPPAGASLQFALRSPASPVRRSYRSQKESESAISVPVDQDQGMLFALLPDGRVLRSVSGRLERPVALPRLPRGFRYTDLVKWGTSLVVPWEEASFTDVGRAGILILPLP